MERTLNKRKIRRTGIDIVKAISINVLIHLTNDEIYNKNDSIEDTRNLK